jgi:hypothetical protein
MIRTPRRSVPAPAGAFRGHAAVDRAGRAPSVSQLDAHARFVVALLRRQREREGGQR